MIETLPGAGRHAGGDVQPLHASRAGWPGRGGWSADRTRRQRFADYAARVTEHLGRPPVVGLHAERAEPHGDDAQHRASWPWVRAIAAPHPSTAESERGGVGGFDPARYRMGIVAADVERMATAHRLAVQAIKAAAARVKVGWTLALVDFQPAEGRRGAVARGAAGRPDRLARRLGRRRLRRGADLLPRRGSDRTASSLRPKGPPTMQTGWEVYPEALGHTVRLAAEHAGVPVLVTENGMATDDDEARIAYTRARSRAWPGAIADGIDVRGYLHWTLLDNFEWNAGYLQDVRPHRRRPRDLRPYGQAVGPLAGPGGPAQRPRLSADAVDLAGQRRSDRADPSTSKPTRSMSGARRARSKP